MSAVALQRVVVRMMYDPAFRKRVYDNPERVLRDVPLTPQERQWLVKPTPSAYGADVHRRSRALTGLLEEFPVASALAMRLPHGLQRLQQFFATHAFHDCVQSRGSMAAAFGSYLSSETFRSRNTPSEIAHLAVLEAGIARVRRISPPPPCFDLNASITAETPIGLASWVVLLTVHPDTLARYYTLLESLQASGKSIVEAVLDTQYRLPRGPGFRGQAIAFVLASHIPGSDGPKLEGMYDELGQLLSAAQTPVPWRQLVALIEGMDCTPKEAEEVLDGVIADRILCPLSFGVTS